MYVWPKRSPKLEEFDMDLAKFTLAEIKDIACGSGSLACRAQQILTNIGETW